MRRISPRNGFCRLLIGALIASAVSATQLAVGDLCLLLRNDPEAGNGDALYSIRYNVPRVFQVTKVDGSSISIRPVDKKESFTYTFKDTFALEMTPCRDDRIRRENCEGCMVINLPGEPPELRGNRNSSRILKIGDNEVKDLPFGTIQGLLSEHNRKVEMAKNAGSSFEPLMLTLEKYADQSVTVNQRQLKLLEPEDFKDDRYMVKTSIENVLGEFVPFNYSKLRLYVNEHVYTYELQYPIGAVCEYASQKCVVIAREDDHYLLKRKGADDNDVHFQYNVHRRKMDLPRNGWNARPKEEKEVADPGLEVLEDDPQYKDFFTEFDARHRLRETVTQRLAKAEDTDEKEASNAPDEEPSMLSPAPGRQTTPELLRYLMKQFHRHLQEQLTSTRCIFSEVNDCCNKILHFFAQVDSASKTDKKNEFIRALKNMSAGIKRIDRTKLQTMQSSSPELFEQLKELQESTLQDAGPEMYIKAAESLRINLKNKLDTLDDRKKELKKMINLRETDNMRKVWEIILSSPHIKEELERLAEGSMADLFKDTEAWETQLQEIFRRAGF